MRGAPGIPKRIADFIWLSTRCRKVDGFRKAIAGLLEYQKGALRGSFFILISYFDIQKSHKLFVASIRFESRQDEYRTPDSLNPPQAHSRRR